MKFQKETRVAAPPEEVFAFHEQPEALERLMPPWEPVKIAEPPPSIQVGSRAVFEGRLGPMSIRWVAEHTEYDPPRRFADRQVSGPFASWYHAHEFLDDGEGGTILRDTVEYELPGGVLGKLLGGGFTERKLQKMFDYRHRVTKEAVEGSKTPGNADEPPSGPA